MIFITEKTVRANLNKFGIKTTGAQAITDITRYLNKCLVAFTKTKVATAMKKASKSPQSMSGGRIVLPGEYFGAASTRYFPTVTSTDMTVTAEIIRPAIPTHDISGAIQGGGAPAFIVPASCIKTAFIEAMLDVRKTTKIDADALKMLKNHFEALMTDFFKKVSKRGVVVSGAEDFETVASVGSKFKILSKK
jgi:hypothetical protein